MYLIVWGMYCGVCTVHYIIILGIVLYFARRFVHHMQRAKYSATVCATRVALCEYTCTSLITITGLEAGSMSRSENTQSCTLVLHRL